MIVVDICHDRMVKWNFGVVLRLHSIRWCFLHRPADEVPIYRALQVDEVAERGHQAANQDVAYSTVLAVHVQRASVERASVVKDVANPVVATH